jgi:hypothetical protein
VAERRLNKWPKWMKFPPQREASGQSEKAEILTFSVIFQVRIKEISDWGTKNAGAKVLQKKVASSNGFEKPDHTILAAAHHHPGALLPA